MNYETSKERVFQTYFILERGAVCFVNRDRRVGGRSCLHLQSGVKSGRERNIEILRVPNKLNISVRLLKLGFGSKIKLLKSYILLQRLRMLITMITNVIC